MIKKSTLALTLGLMAGAPAAFADSNMSSIEARLAALEQRLQAAEQRASAAETRAEAAERQAQALPRSKKRSCRFSLSPRNLRRSPPRKRRITAGLNSTATPARAC